VETFKQGKDIGFTLFLMVFPGGVYESGLQQETEVWRDSEDPSLQVAAFLDVSLIFHVNVESLWLLHHTFLFS
jgi:hypothetical protein